MVIGETSIHLKEELLSINVQLLDQTMQNRASRSIPGVEHHFDLSIEVELFRNFVHVWSDGIHLPDTPLPRFEIVIADQPVHVLDRLAMESSGPANRFETVVFRWIMT